MESLNVQYGCGLSAPPGWKNFDASPTLRIQKVPILGSVLSSRLNAIFPKNVLYGDIIKGLPVRENSCDAVYCSHVLEHLSLKDFRVALKNTYKIMRPEGVFRCVVPDLEVLAKNYVKSVNEKDPTASIRFCGSGSLMGVEDRPKSIKGRLITAFGNSHHLWMWDRYSLASELGSTGFVNIRVAKYNDSEMSQFKLVEDESRFLNAVAIECRK